MIVKKLSLNIVRLCVRKPAYPHMMHAAVTSAYWPTINYDKTLIHGRIVTYSLK